MWKFKCIAKFFSYILVQSNLDYPRGHQEFIQSTITNLPGIFPNLKASSNQVGIAISSFNFLTCKVCAYKFLYNPSFTKYIRKQLKSPYLDKASSYASQTVLDDLAKDCMIISAGPILAETEKPQVLSNWNRSEPTSVKHKEPNKNRNRNWEPSPRVTESVEIEQNQANFLWNVAIFD